MEFLQLHKIYDRIFMQHNSILGTYLIFYNLVIWF